MTYRSPGVPAVHHVSYVVIFTQAYIAAGDAGCLMNGSLTCIFVQATASTAQSIAVAAQNYTAVPLQTVSYAAPSTSQQQAPIITDPGRTIVQAPKPVEPVFVAPANSVQIKRVMHSEVYLK